MSTKGREFEKGVGLNAIRTSRQAEVDLDSQCNDGPDEDRTVADLQCQLLYACLFFVRWSWFRFEAGMEAKQKATLSSERTS